MKGLIFFTILITFLFVTCEPAATFDQPQPADTQAISDFPGAIQGTYLSTDSISYLTISENMITRIYDVDEKAHKDSLGSGYKLIGDTLVDLVDNSKEKIKLAGDSVMVHLHSIDTLFQISSDNVLKKFKGYYILNKRYTDSAWEVHKMHLRGDKLTIGDVSGKEDIDKLKEITKSEKVELDSVPISIPIHFTLSEKQFKKFVKQDGFGKEETFRRISYY